MSHEIPYLRDIPNYSQHPNGCGLASLLMLLDLPQNVEIRVFLDEMWEIIAPLYQKGFKNLKELKWAIVLQYILLKILGYGNKKELYLMFNQRLSYSYEDARIINKFTQEKYRQDLIDHHHTDEAFLYLYYTELDDLLTPPIIFRNLHTMKTDIELKILAELFCYKFDPQMAEDLTGAVYFTRKQISSRISQTVKTKWRKLESWANNKENIILYGQAHHWLAIRGIYREFQYKAWLKRQKEKEKITQTKNENSSLELENGSNEKSSKIEKSQNMEGTTAEHIHISHQDLTDGSKTKATLMQIEQIFEQEQNEKEEWNPRKMVIELNDPAFAKNDRVLFNQISESDRFYIFAKRDENLNEIFSKILSYTREDILKEQDIWKKHVNTARQEKKLKKTIDQNLKK